MRIYKDLLALRPLLLTCTLAIVLARSAAFPNSLQLPLSLPFHISQYTISNEARDDRSLLARTRDRIIQTVWDVPSRTQLNPLNPESSARRPNPPSQVLARYNGDLVLRFEIQFAEEAKALADAVNVLFLDVWEFTTEWVDIRLSKDVVCFSQ